MPKIISVQNLSVNYGAYLVLEAVNFEVAVGDYLALVGPNGAGKTTLVKALLGLLPYQTGTISILGEDRQGFNAWGKIGYLPQRAAAFNPLFPATVSEVVGLGLIAEKKFPKRLTSADREKIKQTLELLEISDLAGRPVGKLSGGQQQRVFLARSIVAGPELLILDEPSTALDPQTRNNFFDLLKKLNSESKVTIILITHDVGQVGRYASRLLYLDKTVIFYGKFSDFCESGDMSKYFGDYSQHLICHQHD
ncbi:MAG: ABC-type Mn/Zn transport system ATPase component [Parcubacteria group bacterium GW2011_GWC2_44_22]|nr:MAG: ABC-type Mn/Zn transport system ATPase component [Parcubacteria group bacterium GW2011_GWC2_44_22]